MKLKKTLYLAVCLCLIFAMCANFASCNSSKETQTATESTDTQNDATESQKTETPKVETMAEQILKKAKLNTYDPLSALYPIWNGNICFNEACFVRQNSYCELDPIQLLYPVEEIIAVRSGDLLTLYKEGVDINLKTEK